MPRSRGGSPRDPACSATADGVADLPTLATELLRKADNAKSWGSGRSAGSGTFQLEPIELAVSAAEAMFPPNARDLRLTVVTCLGWCEGQQVVIDRCTHRRVGIQ